jgi:predicted TPR repeat methyltransferase
MRSRPAAFDAVVAADALVYFGALGEVLAAASACLRPGGVVAFTLEALESGPAPEGYRLAPHGRYAHDAAYVREALAVAGFRDLRMTGAVLRQEAGQGVQGHVALARAGEPPP